MTRGDIDRSELMGVLNGKVNKLDKLRFAIMYLISTETIPPNNVEIVEMALRKSEVNTSAFQYVKKIKSLNISLSSENSASRRLGVTTGVKNLSLAEKLYLQSISTVTTGVKNLLSSDHQLVVSRTVEALMESTPNPEIDSYLVFDPHAPNSTAGSSCNHLKVPFKEAIVFMVMTDEFVERLARLGKKIGFGNRGIRRATPV
ncbi:membrane trafficking regulatory protein [Lithospermum erythrorhizon]|uniref:Membrane trafficking regulatory protein n=1 Tax=Lithospermum erythrorhizon TaxID=34254 RepID=A0AAV3RZQ5_LITER